MSRASGPGKGRLALDRAIRELQRGWVGAGVQCSPRLWVGGASSKGGVAGGLIGDIATPGMVAVMGGVLPVV